MQTTTEGEKNGKRKSKIIYRTSQNIRITKVCLESLLSESFPSLGVTVHLTSNTVLISGPTVEAAQILIWSYSCVFLPPMSTAIRTFVGTLSVHRHRVCLVDCVDLICSLYSWWEGFGSSSLATLPWVSIVVLFPPVHVGRPLGLAPGAVLEDSCLSP